MAFGLLGSIIPQINRNEVFYTSEISNVAFGKVSISNKNYNPAKIRLGITEDDINIEYLEYNRFINYGETFESETIYVGNGQKLVARSNDSNVNFLFYGETVNEGGNPNISGLLSSVVSTNTQKKVLYTAPANSNVLVTLSVCNLGSIPSKARIGLSNAGLNSFDSTEYLEYDVEIGPNQTYTRTDIKLNQNQTIICSSSEDSNINFVCHGRYFYGSLSNDLNVTGDARINGNLGIGTNGREKIDVIGSGRLTGNLDVGQRLSVGAGATIEGGLTVGGLVYGNISNSNLNQSLLNLGVLPAINGSALTGVIATGVGVQVQDDNVPVGTASTINFGPNVQATFSAGIASITTSPDVNIANNLTVATNKFSINGSTGNAQVGGSLEVNSSVTVSGNINTLNNKVINVGSATSSTDATNKRYVDTRSIAMSIALS